METTKIYRLPLAQADNVDELKNDFGGEIAIRNNKYVLLVPLPEFATNGSAAMDLYSANLAPVVIKPGERMMIKSGLKVAVAVGYELQIRPRSGLALKNGITLLNTPGTVDSDYRGEVGFILINHGDTEFTVEPFSRMAQGVIQKLSPTEVKEVYSEDYLGDTERGEGGFGHTGLKEV